MPKRNISFSRPSNDDRFSSSLDRHRLPADVELMSQISLHPRGITAAKIADVIHATVSNTMLGLHRLHVDGYINCDDDIPQAWTVWHRVDTNPKKVVTI